MLEECEVTLEMTVTKADGTTEVIVVEGEYDG